MNKCRVEVPVGKGVALLIDADVALSAGLFSEGQAILQCREYDVQVIMTPRVSLREIVCGADALMEV